MEGILTYLHTMGLSKIWKFEGVYGENGLATLCVVPQTQRVVPSICVAPVYIYTVEGSPMCHACSMHRAHDVLHRTSWTCTVLLQTCSLPPTRPPLAQFFSFEYKWALWTWPMSYIQELWFFTHKTHFYNVCIVAYFFNSVFGQYTSFLPLMNWIIWFFGFPCRGWSCRSLVRWLGLPLKMLTYEKIEITSDLCIKI